MTFATIAHAAVLAKSGGITLDPIAKPIAAVLAFFYGLVPNYGVAIVLLTIAVMIILTPLTIKQTRSMLVMQKLQPEMKRLQEEHKNDRQALNEAVMALYKEHNASPLGGCLPMLLPFPVFFALFRVLEGLSRMVKDLVTGHVVSKPKYLTPSTKMYHDIQAHGGTLKAFGMDLSKSALSVKGSIWATMPYFILLLLMVGTQFYQQRQLTSRNPQAAQGQQAQIMKFFPLLFGVISIRFPAGVVLYWTVSNIIRIFQQWAMYRYDPKVKALVEADVKEVEAKTREIEDAKPTTRPRFRDLLSGVANPTKDPNGSDAGGTGRPAGKAPGKTPPAGKVTPPRGKAAPPAGKPASPGAKSSKPIPAKSTPATKSSPPPPAKAAPPKAPPAAKAAEPKTVPQKSDKPGPTGAGNGAATSARNGGAGNGAPATSGDDDVASGANGSPSGRTGAGRTGAGGARTGGNRGKRTRRGR